MIIVKFAIEKWLKLVMKATFARVMKALGIGIG